MLTKEQQTDLIARYKAKQSYKQIFNETGIPGATAASFLRRKAPQVLRRSRALREATAKVVGKRMAAELGLTENAALWIYGSMRERFDNKKINAKADNREFTIVFEDIVFPKDCPVLGIPLDYLGTNPRADNYPTYDRLNNNLGYVNGNVAIISWRANRIKNDGTAEEHSRIAAFLTRNSST